MVLPANPDQVLVAQQVQALGAGHTLWRTNGLPVGNGFLDRVTSTQIRRAVDDLIADQDCVRACKVLGQEIERYDGATASAGVLERAATPD